MSDTASLRERAARYARLARAARERGDYAVAAKHERTLARTRESIAATMAAPEKRGRGRKTGVGETERDGVTFVVQRLRKGHARGIREARTAFHVKPRVARQPVRGDRIFTTEEGVWLAAGSQR